MFKLNKIMFKGKSGKNYIISSGKLIKIRSIIDSLSKKGLSPYESETQPTLFF